MSDDQTIQRLALVRKVTAFANLGVYPSPSILAQSMQHMEALGKENADGVLTHSSAALNALLSNLLPSQSICQASMRELDRMLHPLRAQRREVNAAAPEYVRPRPN